MKTLDKIGLIVFSDLVLLLSIIICLVVFGWLSVEDVYFTIKAVTQDQTATNVVLGFSIAFISHPYRYTLNESLIASMYCEYTASSSAL